MKAQIYDQITTLTDIRVDFGSRIIPKGTLGTVVECYQQPEGYAVDLAIPDERLVGNFEYENVTLNPEQFAVLSQNTETVDIGIW
ncbi:DUF4926 domain-containing protein [Kovacikia minuta CCNUW1]|uniref:DUF4926 domain-containing protein n=1 Tax=Kovacikia minuta TaxID=2931930 RepID=UPI001CCC56B7|nr:DUF4926 domain-containing protein [Kovacikia minuta]UBF27784.1 DUF4926 domain-containing protein [Kovacikia minuta CCNUW1]